MGGELAALLLKSTGMVEFFVDILVALSGEVFEEESCL